MKRFLAFFCIDRIGLKFYHRHCEFLRVLGQNPSSSASLPENSGTGLSAGSASAEQSKTLRARWQFFLQQYSQVKSGSLRLRMRHIFPVMKSLMRLTTISPRAWENREFVAFSAVRVAAR